MATRRNRNSHRGITLIEALAVVGILVILAALALPALSRSRRSADITSCLSVLSSNMRCIAVAAGDQGGRWPSLVDPRGPGVDVESSDQSVEGVGYFTQVRQWVGGVFGSRLYLESVAAAGIGCPAFIRTKPERAGEPSWTAESYLYTWAVLTDPTLWDQSHAERRQSPRQFERRIGVAEVLYPSKKVILGEAADFHGDGSALWSPMCLGANAGFADGHAERTDPRAALPALMLHIPQVEWGFLDLPRDTPIPFSSAADGCRGRDFQ